MTAAIEAWKGYEPPPNPESPAERYEHLWALYTGEAFNAAWRRRGVFRHYRVYRRTRLIWSHVEAFGDFYAANVYQGALATDGKRLPDGSRGAIPIDAQTGSTTGDAALLAGIAALWDRWNWQEGMVHRPRYVSVLGDGLTELIDDPARHAVWPQFVWPGYVPEVELDRAGNVKRYVVEYPIVLVRNGQARQHLFRKEVDGAAFRYWLDDQPWRDPEGHGDAEQPNPYGFVPAIWDRFKPEPRSVRGLSGLAGIRQSLVELNAMLSHAMDYQRKAFGAPVLIKGSIGGDAHQVIGPRKPRRDPDEIAEELNFKEVGPTGGIEQIAFDVGQTLAMLEMVREGIWDANPEVRFYKELRAMSQLTGPGAERALGDAVTRLNLARYGFDAQSKKLFQMALAICGFRLGSGAWQNPDPRDRVFAPFGLDSYKAGQLDFTILPRGAVPQTFEERIAIEAQIDRLESQAALRELGFEETDAQARIDDRAATARALGILGEMA